MAIMSGRRKKLIFIAASLLGVVVLAGAVLLLNANRILKHEIEKALGEGFSVRSIDLRWGSVRAEDARIIRPDGKEFLAVPRFDLSADFLGLLKKENAVSGILLEKPSLLLEVDRRGVLLALPPATGGKAKADSTGQAPFLVRRLEVKDGSLDYLDRKVRGGPVLIRLRNVEAEISGFTIPLSTKESPFLFSAVIPGNLGSGTMKSKGFINLKNGDSKSSLEVRNLDITGLRRYYEKPGDVEVTRGFLSVEAKTTVMKSRISSSGTMTIRDLSFRADKGKTVLGLPLAAVTNLLKDKNNEITLDFVVEGDLKNPKFSIRDSLVQKVALSLVKMMGLPVEAIGKTLFDIGGGALRKIFP